MRRLCLSLMLGLLLGLSPMVVDGQPRRAGSQGEKTERPPENPRKRRPTYEDLLRRIYGGQVGKEGDQGEASKAPRMHEGSQQEGKRAEYGRVQKEMEWRQKVGSQRSPRAHTYATIHLLIFSDTDDSRVGSSCEETERYFRGTLVPQLECYSGMHVQTHYFKGSDFTLSALRTAVWELESGPDDTVLFYFTGHGYRWRLPGPRGG